MEARHGSELVQLAPPRWVTKPGSDSTRGKWQDVASLARCSNDNDVVMVGSMSDWCGIGATKKLPVGALG
jgi:hypothetical protein